MKRFNLTTGAAALAIALCQSPLAAQSHDHPHLHVNSRWDECSFQLSPSLTQAAWRQFTQEAGLVVYFRPMSDARPMGRKKFEVSILQWETAIDDSDAAWNDTFVHPDSTHWLFEGNGQQVPGLMVRAGVGDKTDVGVYVTKSPGANYGFYGVQLQRAIVGNATSAWAVSARGSFLSMYGPEDLTFAVYGGDLVASRSIALARWITVSPYASVSTYLATAHEKTAVVTLDDERVVGAQATMGAALQLSKARLSAEYNFAKVGSTSLKIGFGI